MSFAPSDISAFGGPVTAPACALNMGPVLPPRKGAVRGNFCAGQRSFVQIVFHDPANHYILTNRTEWTKNQMNAPGELNFEDMLRIRLGILIQEHRDLDDAIHALQHSARGDALTLRRLKKQKLALKDHIVKIEDQLIPDIIA